MFPGRIDVNDLAGPNGFAVEGINPNFGNGVGSGTAVSGAGDINGDGIEDFVVGVRRAASGTPGSPVFEAGEVYVVFGRVGGFAASFDPSTLNGTNGFRIDGGREALALGFSIDAAGDFNGDGFDDLVIGTQAESLGQSAVPGEAFVLFGRATGFAPAIDINALAPGEGFRIVDPNPSIPGQLGRAVAGIGDFNDDGFDDIAIGEAKSGNPFQSSLEDGAVHVIFGSAAGFPTAPGPGGTTPSALPSGFANAITFHGPLQDAGLGTSIARGDFNGDGISDMVTLAPGAPFRSPAERFGVVLFGDDTYPAPGYFSYDLSALPQDASAGFLLRQVSDPAAVVGNAGDVNGDGIDDILIGAPNGVNPVTGQATGLVAVVFGTATPSFNVFPANLDGTNGFFVFGDEARGLLGSSVATAGDINNDGYDDVIIGAPGENRTPIPGQTSDWLAGAAYVVYGGPSPVAANLFAADLDGQNGFAIEGLSPASVNPDDGLGQAVTGNVDVNGDGIDDIIVGAPDATSLPGTVSEVRAGRTYVIYGRDEGTMFGTQGPDNLVGTGNADRIFGLAGADDIAGGNGRDMIVGGAGDDVLAGNARADTLDGEDGDDVLEGGGGSDSLDGGAGEDTLRGNDGDDLLLGKRGNDRLSGGRGNDTMSGGVDNDQLQGGRGADELSGGSGNDRLAGNEGGDVLSGDNGDDVLIADAGSDTLTGGAGADVFQFSGDFGRTVVTDFADGVDVIRLRSVRDENGGAPIDASQLRFVDVGADVRIFLDLDRDGANDSWDLDGDGDVETVRIELRGVSAQDLSDADFIF